MAKPKIDLIFNGTEFNTDFLHNGNGECPYCFLNFTHQHCTGYKLKEFIKINLPTQETWEERFDKEFPFGSFAGSSTKASEVKDFIRKEFIDIEL